MRSQEYDFSNCNYGLRTDRFASMAEAIGTNHGVLDAPTINASCCQAHAPYLSSQFSESFADQQSFAALTKHRSSFFITRLPTARRLSLMQSELTWYVRRSAK